MKTPLKTVSLDTMIDNHIGKRGTQKREIFESKLEIELLDLEVKPSEQDSKLTQKQSR
jgi:hypothetical protein